MQFFDWDFSPDLSAAVHIGSSEEIHFTRAERSLLQALMSYRGRIWTRETLLDAVSGFSEEASDRSIDFIVNRLRHKLRDSARRPLYIKTRYGEGYVWIAESPAIQTRARSALPPIGVRLNGNAVMSYCDRPHAERSVLQQHADSVLVLRLQGFLFFGAANRIREEIQQEPYNALDYLILDFHNVLGLDDTAIPVLKDLERLARERGFELIVSSARAVIEYHMHRLESRRFPCLDAALEWRETQILKANPTEVPTELTLADDLAAELDHTDVTIILGYFRPIVVSPDTDIIRAGTHTRDMFFFERGTVEVLIDIEDEVARVSRIWPGTLFGEIGFHCGGARTATLRPLEECGLVCMERSAVARLEADFPTLALALYRLLARCAAKRLLFYNDLVVDLLRSTLR